jgi:hypothetical protein
MRELNMVGVCCLLVFIKYFLYGGPFFKFLKEYAHARRADAIRAVDALLREPIGLSRPLR